MLQGLSQELNSSDALAGSWLWLLFQCQALDGDGEDLMVNADSARMVLLVV